MLCRVADSVFWLNRYIERAENVARFIDVNYNLTLGESDSFGKQWAPLIYTTGDQDLFQKKYGEPTRENVIRFLAFDEDVSNSIISCVAKARENARAIREILSSVVWEQLNKFYLMVRSESHFQHALQEPQEFCKRVRLASHLFVGATQTTMAHDDSWHFARLGRLLERADKTSRIVDVQYYLLLPDPQQVGTALDVVRWSAMLKSASALEMYRRKHGKIIPQRVADFLILDRHFPRAMHSCMVNALESLSRITGSAPGTFRNQSERFLGRLCSNMDYSDISDIIQAGLHEYIDNFQSQLNGIGNAIVSDFFGGEASTSGSAQSQA